MTNFVQLQDDITQVLLSCDLLANINVMQYRKLRIQSEVDLSLVFMTPRNGRLGCGLMVEMPTMQVEHPNLPGPPSILGCSVVAMEEPNLNLDPTQGTLMPAEDAVQIALEEIHDLLIEGLGELVGAQNRNQHRAIEPVNEFEGVVAYRASASMSCPRTPRQRVLLPTIQEAALVVTLTCGTAGAEIRYTVDGTCPAPSNPGSVIYAEPFDLNSSDRPITLRWAAFKGGLRQSYIGQCEAS